MEEQKTQETNMNTERNADLLEQKKLLKELKEELKEMKAKKDTPIEAQLSRLGARITAIEESLFQEVNTVKGRKTELKPIFRKRFRR